MSDNGEIEQMIALVTGGTDGIGKEVARGLARQGEQVWIVGRNRTKGSAVEAELSAEGDVRFIAADLSRLAEVRALAKDVLEATDSIDVLVHCAGIMRIEHRLNDDGIEQNFALNYLQRFLLTELLRPALIKGKARVVNVAGAGMAKPDLDLDSLPGIPKLNKLQTFFQSQAANDVWVQDIANRLGSEGVVVTGIMPGAVATNIRKNDGNAFVWRLFDLKILKPLTSRFMLTPEQAAITPVWLATDPDTANANGKFFGPKKKSIAVDSALTDTELQDRLRAASVRLVGGKI